MHTRKFDALLKPSGYPARQTVNYSVGRLSMFENARPLPARCLYHEIYVSKAIFFLLRISSALSRSKAYGT